MSCSSQGDVTGIASVAYLVCFGLTGSLWLVLSLTILLTSFVVAGLLTMLFVQAILVLIHTTGLWKEAILSV